jgi:hypothetical protein
MAHATQDSVDGVTSPGRGGKGARWWSAIAPREYGSWSLAFEPLVFGLIAAPSAAGASLAVSVVAAFFARRPLRAICRASDAKERALAIGPLVALGVVAAVALGGAVWWGGMAWLGWLLPAAAAGAVFLYFDLQAAGREGVAEVAGAAAFAWVPAAMAAAAGSEWAAAGALAVAMLGRAVPAVLTVRACLRAAKTGRRQPGAALVTTGVALIAGLALVRGGLAPTAAAVLLALLALRTGALLVWPRPVWRARTLGMIETVLGIGFVVGVGLAWR